MGPEALLNCSGPYDPDIHGAHKRRREIIQAKRAEEEQDSQEATPTPQS